MISTYEANRFGDSAVQSIQDDTNMTESSNDCHEVHTQTDKLNKLSTAISCCKKVSETSRINDNEDKKRDFDSATQQSITEDFKVALISTEEIKAFCKTLEESIISNLTETLIPKIRIITEEAIESAWRENALRIYRPQSNDNNKLPRTPAEFDRSGLDDPPFLTIRARADTPVSIASEDVRQEWLQKQQKHDQVGCETRKKGGDVMDLLPEEEGIMGADRDYCANHVKLIDDIEHQERNQRRQQQHHHQGQSQPGAANSSSLLYSNVADDDGVRRRVGEEGNATGTTVVFDTLWRSRKRIRLIFDVH